MRRPSPTPQATKRRPVTDGNRLGAGRTSTGHYAVDVTVSDHDALKRGILARPVVPAGPTWYRVLVSATEARDDVEAMLIAAQMASCHGMCTSAELVSWPSP